MRVSEAISVLERLASLALAEPWDRAGLQIGDPASPLRRALLCIDMTQAVVREAIKARAGLIVAYHPPIFEPLKSLAEVDWKSRAVSRCIRAGISVYSPHTALDAAEGGMNDWLAGGLGKGDVAPIKPASLGAAARCKIVVFAPTDYAAALREAMSRAGAGRIGEYRECSFSTPGEGTFRGSDSANPAIGKAGRFERVKELRLEMVCDMKLVPGVMAAVRDAHPYEEPAIDLYRLEPEPSKDVATGSGRIITFNRPVTIKELSARLKRRLGVRSLFTGVPTRVSQVRRVGVSVGAGGSLLEQAGDIDAFITGEMRHHDALAAVERGVAVILAGHTQTERPYLREYRRRIMKAATDCGRGKEVEWIISREDGACWNKAANG